jgi:hypothetical protein
MLILPPSQVLKPRAAALLGLAMVTGSCTPAQAAASLQAAEPQRRSVVYGKVLDAFDGRPLPGLDVLDMTPGYERARGACNPGGSFYLKDKDGDALQAPPGEFALAFEDGGHWVHGLMRTLVVPEGREVLIDIGPTFFLDLPDEVPLRSKDLEAVLFGPSDDESRALTRLNGTPVTIRTDSYDTQIDPPWVRLPQPLGDGEHWLRLRWGDPLLEGRALLPTKMGRYAPRLEIELAPLGAIDVSVVAGAIPRAQPFTLRSVGRPRTVDRHAWIPRPEGSEPATLRLDWLPPGKYDWQLGFDGYFGSGTVTIAGGEDSVVSVAKVRAASDASDVVRVKLDVTQAPDVDLSQAAPMVIPNGLREARDRAGVRLVGSHEEGGFALEIEDLGPGRWWVGVGTPGSFQILPQAVLVQDGVALGTLRVEPVAPRMPLQIKLTPPGGRTLHGNKFRITYFEGPRPFNFISEASDAVEIDVPSTRSTPLYAYTESYGLTLFIFDPSNGVAELELPLEDQLHQSLIRATDDSGGPLRGVSVDCGDRRLGETDALGHLWIDLQTSLHGLIRVGASNPELEQVFPFRQEFELGVDVRNFPAGFHVMMRRRN